ncbi:MAG: recombinase family protein [Succinivibrio dextrinosolvens]|nr:recombinase family protein [Succinivibrio dextrinosolvens]
MKRLIGYCRVSSRDQNLERQIVELKSAGCETIYQDKSSGKDLNRPAYQKMLTELKPGDCVVFSSLDRLSRNYDDTSSQWKLITQEKRCDIKILDMPILDTTSQTSGLTGKVITNIVIELMAYCANLEREKIKDRQAAGIKVAKTRGVKFGRTLSLSKEQFLFHYDRLQYGTLSVSQFCKELGISRKTFYNLKEKYIQQ